jgi:hypothetical protein
LRIVLLLFIILLLIGCQKESTSPTEQNDPKLGELFDLIIGRSATISDEPLTFQFANVPTDSRCPIGAYCKWAGNASVVIKFSDIQDTVNTYLDPREITYRSYNITLLKLSPYPEVGMQMDTVHYVAQFVVTKN